MSAHVILPKKAYMKLLKYFIAGGAVYVTNVGLLYVLTDLFHLWYLMSSGCAYVIAFIVSFVLQKFWAFNNKDLSVWKKQLGSSFALSLANFMLNMVSMFILVEYADINYLYAQVIISGMIAVISFFVYQYIIFRPIKYSGFPGS